jgi:hypothetical protein
MTGFTLRIGGRGEARLYLRVVLIALVLQQAALNVVALLRQADITYLKRFFLGYDYANAYQATQVWLAGGDPWTVRGFVWLPLSLVLNAPLARLGLEAAALVVFIVNLGVVCLSVERFLAGLGLARRAPEFLVILLLYYPFYHLLDRGTPDGLVMALLILFAVSLENRKEGRAGVLLFAAFGLTAYPALLLLPLVFMGRWRVLAGFAAAGGIAGALMPETWIQLLQALFRGATEFNPVLDPVSVFVPFLFLAERIKGLSGLDLHGPFEQLARITWLATLALAVIADLRRFGWRGRAGGEGEMPTHLLLYLPWMMSFPGTVRADTLILCVPLLAVFVRLSEKGRFPPGVGLFLAAWLLSGVQAGAWRQVFGIAWGGGLNALGILLLLAWVPWCKFRLAKE